MIRQLADPYSEPLTPFKRRYSCFYVIISAEAKRRASERYQMTLNRHIQTINETHFLMHSGSSVSRETGNARASRLMNREGSHRTNFIVRKMPMSSNSEGDTSLKSSRSYILVKSGWIHCGGGDLPISLRVKPDNGRRS
jgi:hypothetical protein